MFEDSSGVVVASQKGEADKALDAKGDEAIPALLFLFDEAAHPNS